MGINHKGNMRVKTKKADAPTQPKMPQVLFVFVRGCNLRVHEETL